MNKMTRQEAVTAIYDLLVKRGVTAASSEQELLLINDLANLIASECPCVHRKIVNLLGSFEGGASK